MCRPLAVENDGSKLPGFNEEANMKVSKICILVSRACQRWLQKYILTGCQFRKEPKIHTVTIKKALV